VSAAFSPKAWVAAVFIATSLTGRLALAQLPDFSGRPVAELIETLRQSGRRIAYSRDLLPPGLRVTVVPASDDVFEGLREVLSPYGLDVEPGPRDTWVIVRRDPVLPAPAESADAPAFVLTRPSLETVVVTTSRYPIERQAAVSSNEIARHALETAPALGQDPLRISHRLPGISSDQLSSPMHIRGGDLDEVLIRLDGVRLYSPYHLKDFQNVFSSINPRIIESMDVRTGGYEARFGDRMSGVIDMRSITPTDYRHHELGISFLESSVLSSGLFGNGRGSWVTSIRRGNLDVLAKSGDSDIGTPQYVDFFNKVDFAVSPRLAIETGALSLDDKISLNDGDDATAGADYSDFYSWVTITQNLDSGLKSSYQLSSANLNRSRIGSIDEVGRVTGSLSERSRFDRNALTAEWSFQPWDKLWINWGAEVANMALDHDFESTRNLLLLLSVPELDGVNDPPALANISLDQRKTVFHASFRIQPIARLITEIGLRRDQQSLLNTAQTSPRVNLRFDLTSRTRLRAAWGEFVQSDSLSEIAVADGMSSLRPTEEAHHLIVGVEHAFGESGLMRFEVYEKTSDALSDRFENAFERVSLLPELLPDRALIDPLGADTRGVEISIEGQARRIGWWANIALARTREDLASGTYRRSWDERRAIKFGGEWSGRNWDLTATATYRSGWPIGNLTLVDGAVVANNYNRSRLPNFSSIDVRASRTVEARHGSFEWFIEISNLADHANYCCIDYELIPANGAEPARLIAERDDLLGIVPNLGIRWQF